MNLFIIKKQYLSYYLLLKSFNKFKTCVKQYKKARLVKSYDFISRAFACKKYYSLANNFIIYPYWNLNLVGRICLGTAK